MMDTRKFVKVKLLDGQTFLLLLKTDRPKVLSGTEVNSEGDEIVPKGVDGDGNRFTERTRIIEKALIKSVQPLKFNNTYGTLEVDHGPGL